MPTVQQQNHQAQPEEAINFQVPAEFKLELDLEVKRKRTTLRDFCTRAIAKELGISHPGAEPVKPKRKSA